MRRIRRILRSPHTAMWLIALAGVWLFLGTLVPQDAADIVSADSWRTAHPVLAQVTQALDLHAAYSHPVLLTLVILLAASTAVCAWDRTGRSLRSWRSAGTLAESELAALRTRPHLTLKLPAEDTQASNPLADVERVLGAMRLRSRRGPSVLLAWSPRPGLLGSPIFHWALVALMLVAPLGWLLRSEGLIGVVEGESVLDAAESYGALDVGPFHGELSGLEIGVTAPLELSFVVDGIERGVAPVVTLSDGQTVVAQGRVRANSPLRYGSMLVHQSDYGVGVVLGDDVGGRESFLIDFSTESDGVASTSFEMGSETTPTVVVIIPHLEVGPDGMVALYEPREVRVNASGEREWSEVLREGDRFEAAGVSITIERIGYYARLSVVDNPVIYLIYALLGCAVLGITLAVSLPFRVVQVLLVNGDDGRALHVRVTNPRREASFVARLNERFVAAGAIADTYEQQNEVPE